MNCELNNKSIFCSASFEDKRKENYDKGQAELERRRKQLADIQKKEQEERERKEREEAEKREKVKVVKAISCTCDNKLILL